MNFQKNEKLIKENIYVLSIPSDGIFKWLVNKILSDKIENQ